MTEKKENFFIVTQEFGNSGNVSTQRTVSFADALSEKFNLVVMHNKLSGKASNSVNYENIAINPVNLPKKIDRNGLGFYLGLRKYLRKKIKECPCGILISGGPFYLFLVTTTIKKKYPSIKVFLDYRDYWTINNFDYKEKDKNLIGKITQAFDTILEKKILTNADLISFATDSMKKEYLVKYPNIQNKSMTVFNGFSNNDINIAHSNKKITKLPDNTILVSGKFFYYAPEIIKEFINRITDKEKKIFKIAQIGIPEPDFSNTLEEAGIDYVNLGLVSHKEAIEYASSSIFGLVSNRNKNFIAVKIFDFLVNDKPVLLIGPKSIDLENNYISNFILDADKPLSEIIKEIKHKNYIFDSKLGEKFNREKNAKKLAEEIDKIIK